MNQTNTKTGEELVLELDNRVHSAVRDRLSELMDTYNARTLRFSDGYSLAAGRLASDLEDKIQNSPPQPPSFNIQNQISDLKGDSILTYLSSKLSAQNIGDKVLEELFDRYDIQPEYPDTAVDEVSLDLVSDVVTDIKDNVLDDLVHADIAQGLDGYAIVAKVEENFAENSFDNLLAATYMQVEKEPKSLPEIRASLEEQAFNKYSGDIYVAIDNRLAELEDGLAEGAIGTVGEDYLKMELKNRIDAVSVELGSDKRGSIGIPEGEVKDVVLSEVMYAGMSPMTTRGVSLLVNDAIVEKSLANNDKLVELSDGDIKQLVSEAVENNYESALNNLARNSFLYDVNEAETLDIVERNGRGSDYKSLVGMAFEHEMEKSEGKIFKVASGITTFTDKKAVGELIERLAEHLPQEWRKNGAWNREKIVERYGNTYNYLEDGVAVASDLFRGADGSFAASKEELSKGMEILAKTSYETGYAGRVVAEELENQCTFDELSAISGYCADELKNMLSELQKKTAESPKLGKVEVNMENFEDKKSEITYTCAEKSSGLFKTFDTLEGAKEFAQYQFGGIQNAVVTDSNGKELASGFLNDLSELLERKVEKEEAEKFGGMRENIRNLADMEATVNDRVNRIFDESASEGRFGNVISRDAVINMLDRVAFSVGAGNDRDELAVCVLNEVKKYDSEHKYPTIRIEGVHQNLMAKSALVDGFKVVVDSELNKMRGYEPRGLYEDEALINDLAELLDIEAEKSGEKEFYANNPQIYTDDSISYFDEMIDSFFEEDCVNDADSLLTDGKINHNAIEELIRDSSLLAAKMSSSMRESAANVAAVVGGYDQRFEAVLSDKNGDLRVYKLSEAFKEVVSEDLSKIKKNEHNKEGEKGGGMKPEDIFRAEVKKQAGEFSVAYAGKSGKDEAGKNMSDDAKFGYNNTVFKNHIAVTVDMGDDAGSRRSDAGTYVTNTSYDIGVEKRSLDAAVEAFSKLPEDLKQEVVGYVNELKQEKNEFKSENKLSDAFKELVDVAEAFNPHSDIPESQPKTGRRDPAAVGKWIEHLVDALPEEWKEARRSSVNDFDEHFSENLGYLNNQVEEAYDWLSGGEIGRGEALDILAKASFDTGFAGSYVARELQDSCVTGGKSQEYYKLVDDCGQYLKNLSADASFKPEKVVFEDSRVMGQLQAVGKWVNYVAAVELDTMKDKGVENTYSFRNDKDYAEKQVQSAYRILDVKGYSGSYDASFTLAMASIHTGFGGVDLANELRKTSIAADGVGKFERFADSCHTAWKYSSPGKNVTVNHENTNTNHPFPKRGGEKYTPNEIARTSVPEGQYKGSEDLKNLAETLNVPIGSNLGKVIAISDVAPRGVANGVAVDIAAVGCRLDRSNVHTAVVRPDDNMGTPVYKLSDDKSPLLAVMKYADGKGNVEYGLSVAKVVDGDVTWKEVMQKQRQEFPVVLPVIKDGKPVIDPETDKAVFEQKMKDGKPVIGVVFTDSDKPLRVNSPELALKIGSELTSDKTYTALYQDKDYVKAKTAGPEKAAEVKQDRSMLKIDITD